MMRCVATRDDGPRSAGKQQRQPLLPLSFAPGEAYQFDWSHEIVLLSGVTVTVKAAHVRLCHSRMLFVRAYPRETQEMVFDAHDRAFALFKGTCGRGIYDNMKTAVETVFVGKDRLYNRRFLQMCSHYLVEPVACTPASGWRRAGREPGRSVRERFFTPRLRFKNLDELNAWLLDGSHRLRQGPRHPGVHRQDDLGSVRSGAAEARSLCRPVRRIPCCSGVGLARSLRQQQVLSGSERRRPAGRGSSLCRSHRDPPGRPDHRRTSASTDGRHPDRVLTDGFQAVEAACAEATAMASIPPTLSSVSVREHIRSCDVVVIQEWWPDSRRVTDVDIEEPRSVRPQRIAISERSDRR